MASRSRLYHTVHVHFLVRHFSFHCTVEKKNKKIIAAERKHIFSLNVCENLHFHPINSSLFTKLSIFLFSVHNCWPIYPKKEGIRAKMEPANDDHSEDGQLRSPYNNDDDMGDNDRFVFKLIKPIYYFTLKGLFLFISFLILHRQYSMTILLKCQYTELSLEKNIKCLTHTEGESRIKKKIL